MASGVSRNRHKVQLRVLGVRGEIERRHPRYSKQSGVLIDGKLLLDLGEKSYLKYHPQWILITHLHPDHAYFVRRGCKEVLETEAAIFAPEKWGEEIGVIKRKQKWGPYFIKPLPTHHSKHVLSQAYLVEKNGKSILYTGDLVWIDKRYLSSLKQVDLIITDGSFIREGGMVRRDADSGKLFGHTGIPNLIRLFQPYTNNILFIHFGTWFLRDPKAGRKKLLELGKKYHMHILVGYDGFKLSL